MSENSSLELEKTIVEASVLLVTLLFLIAQIPSFADEKYTRFFIVIAIPLAISTFVALFTMFITRVSKRSKAFRVATSFLEAGLFASGVGGLVGFMYSVVTPPTAMGLITAFVSPLAVLAAAILCYIWVRKASGRGK